MSTVALLKGERRSVNPPVKVFTLTGGFTPRRSPI
jgi:hypothetical protein